MNRRAQADDEGAILILALAFLVLFALFIPILLGSTTTSLSVSSTLELQRKQVYAAEAGLRARVETLRADRSSAVYGQSCGPVTQGTFNGQTVRVQCTPQPSSGSSGITRPRYALLGLPTPGSSTEGVADTPTGGNGGGTSDVYVGGDVASNGKIEHGANGASSHFYISGTAQGRSCVGGNIDDPATNNNVCTVVSTTFTDPGLSSSGYAQSSGFPSTKDPAPVCLSNGVEFLPGYYSAMPTANGCSSAKAWWFSPGLYYFDFTTGTHVLDLDGKTVVAGTPNPLNYNPTATSVTAPVLPGACKVDGDAPPDTGTEWVFGADTVLSVGAGKVELCPTVSATAQEISIRGYGAGGATGTAATTATQAPTSNVQSGSSSYVNPTNVYAIDGSPATQTKSSNSTPSISVSTFQDVPANAVVTKVVLRIKHQEVTSGTTTLSGSVDYGGLNSITTTLPVGCATGQLCQSSSTREDDFDITTDYLSALGATIPTVTAKFTFDNPNNSTTTTETLDGIVLDVTYIAAGSFRVQSGCAILPSATSGSCATVSNATNASLYIQGTVYAPLGAVIITANDELVSLNRGVIARNIAGAIHPGNNSANPFGVGRPQRIALLTAEVSTDGTTWTPRVESLVRLDDNIATASARGRVNYLSWRVIR